MERNETRKEKYSKIILIEKRKQITKQRTKKNEVCLLSLNFKLASKQTKIQNLRKPLYFYYTKYLKNKRKKKKETNRKQKHIEIETK
jgi:hypothetical protein